MLTLAGRTGMRTKALAMWLQAFVVTIALSTNNTMSQQQPL
jgi:hypothetical protein